MMNINAYNDDNNLRIKSFYKKFINKDFTMWPHAHVYFEIMCVISGSIILEIFEKEKIVKSIKIYPNTLVCISSSCFHRIRTEEYTLLSNLEFEASKTKNDNLIKTVAYLKQSQEWENMCKEKYGITIFNDINDISTSINRIISRIQKVGLVNNDLFLESSIFNFFVQLMEAYKVNKQNSEAGTFYVTKAENIIKSNLSLNISVKEIADQLNISVSYLERIFKESIHLTVKKYISLLKLDLIKESLTNTNDSIETICKKFGYENEAQLTYQYKLLYNMTPRAYRKNNFTKSIFETDDSYIEKTIKI